MTAQTALGQILPRVRLNVLSNSAIACYRACPRQFKYRYVMRRRPRRADEALRFGSFFHCGLNAWWNEVGDANDKFSAAVYAMRERAEKNSEDADPYDLVKAEELIRGYTARWGSDVYSTFAVEKVFDVPLVNPETGHASKTYRLSGAIDALAFAPSTTRLIHVEHKTTSSDITPGADYWRKVSALDPQVSTYQAALKALGYEAETLYDVVRKVTLKPYRATPEEKRKYTQEKSKQCPFCKKKGNIPGPHLVSAEGEPELYCEDGRIITERGGRLYENQHDHDETPEEYRERVQKHIAEHPEHYYARGPIVRLERDEQEHAADVWQTANMIRMSEKSGSFPRNPGSCERFHRLCEYFDVCSGIASIDDDSRFRTAEHAHEELQKEI